MKKILLSSIFAFAIVTMANAIVVQKVMLKNGTVLNGYIQEQDGTGKLVFHTDSAIISVNGNSVEVGLRYINKNDLQQPWKAWADNNDAYDHSGNSPRFGINTVTFKRDSIAYLEENKDFEYYLRNKISRATDVKVLEYGEVVKYLELSPNTYTITWKDIVYVQSPRRTKTALSGIDRACKLKTGQTYKGQYAEETEELLKLYLSNGQVRSFKVNDVVKSTFSGINPNQDLFAQSELLDIVKTKTTGELKGIIIEQNYESAKSADNYFVIKTDDQSSPKVYISDILEIRKEENPKFSPKFDIILKDGEVVVNRQPANLVRISEKNDFLQLDSITGAATVQKEPDGGTRIVVEYRSADNSNAEIYQLVKVKEQTVKKDVNYGFTYKDLVNATIRASKIETSVNHTTKAEYTVYEKGIYALYDARSKKAIPLKIE